MREMVPRMKGGAVMDEMSPLKDAIDLGNVSAFECLVEAGVLDLEKGGPRSLVLRRNATTFIFGRARHGENIRKANEFSRKQYCAERAQKIEERETDFGGRFWCQGGARNSSREKLRHDAHHELIHSDPGLVGETGIGHLSSSFCLDVRLSICKTQLTHMEIYLRGYTHYFSNSCTIPTQLPSLCMKLDY